MPSRLAVILHYLLLSVATLSPYSEGGKVSLDYYGDVLFDISWPGQQYETTAPMAESPDIGAAQVQDSPQPSLTELLPNRLLSYEEICSETVTMTVVEKEKYNCVLPDLSKEANEEGTENDDSMSADSLLSPIWHHCVKLKTGYWTYELCHGQYLIQYHEETNTADKIPKIDEYVLGRAEEATAKTELDEPPTWIFNGVEYPYYEVEMGDGTPCDLALDKPRSAKIRYICETVSSQLGDFIHIQELTTCQYQVVVTTAQLCKNKAYRVKEDPIHTVHCYAQDGSPKKPRVLLEHELFVNTLKTKSTSSANAVVSGQQRSSSGSGGRSQATDGASQATDGATPLSHTDTSDLDEAFIVDFLSGDPCLRGGSGWWQHQVCFGLYVKQIHIEGGKVTSDVLLGSWDEDTHKKWFATAGSKKQRKNHVTHLYVEGDVCEVTGKPRECQLRLKCIESSKPSQVSLYLEEPSTCSYILTVEGNFVCKLLETADEHGLFHYPPTTMTDGLDGDLDDSSDSEKPSSQLSGQDQMESKAVQPGTDPELTEEDEEARDSQDAPSSKGDSNSKPTQRL